MQLPIAPEILKIAASGIYETSSKNRHGSARMNTDLRKHSEQSECERLFLFSSRHYFFMKCHSGAAGEGSVLSLPKDGDCNSH